MKKQSYFFSILIIVLTSCNPKIDYSKYIPTQVNNFATGFITNIHNGNIDTCLTQVSPEMNNENGRQFLLKANSKIQTFAIDSFSIINASKTSLLGKNGFTNYWIEYEYKLGTEFIYFTFGISNENQKLTVTAFDAKILDNSLSKTYAFSLRNKGIVHYIFLCFIILIPIFIIVTLIAAIRTKMQRKGLWLIGIIFGFLKLSINWTTGQIGYSLINFSILGAGFSKQGNSAPWILSFSIPIVAIIFWYKKYSSQKQIGTPPEV